MRTPSNRIVDPWLVGPVAALLILTALPGAAPPLGSSFEGPHATGTVPRTSAGPDVRPAVVTPAGTVGPKSLLAAPTEPVAPVSEQADRASSHKSWSASSRIGTLVATIVSAPARVDVGVRVSLTGTASGGTGPYSPFWSFDVGNITNGWSVGWTAPNTARSVPVLFEVRDRAGASAFASVTIAVVGPPFLEVASAGGLGDVGMPFVFTANLTGGSGPFRVDWSSVGGPSNGTAVVPDDGTYRFAVVPASPGPVWVLATVIDVWNRSFDGVTPVGRATPVPSLTGAAIPFAEVGYATPVSLEVAGGTPPFAWTVGVAPGVTAEAPPEGTLGSDGPITFTVTFDAPGTLVVPVALVDGSGVAVGTNVSVVVAGGLNLTVALGASDPIVSEGTTVRATISGGLPPYSFRLALSDGESSAGNASTAGPVTWSIDPVASGFVTLRGVATDATGRSTNVTFTFYVASPSPGAALPAVGGSSRASGWLLLGTLAGTALSLVGGFVFRRWGRWPWRGLKRPASGATAPSVLRELLVDAEDGIDRGTLELLAEERHVTATELAENLASWQRAGRVRIEADADGREVVRWVPDPPPSSGSATSPGDEEPSGAA